MVLAIPLTVKLARQQQILFSRAATAQVEFLTKDQQGTTTADGQSCVTTRNIGGSNKLVTLCPNVKIRLIAPTGDDVKFQGRTSLLPQQGFISTVYAGHLGYEANFCEGNSIVHEYADGTGTHEVQLNCGDQGKVCKDLPNNDAGCEDVCTSDGSCSAATPACGQTTEGKDNCGNPCTKPGDACPAEGLTCTEQAEDLGNGCAKHIKTCPGEEDEVSTYDIATGGECTAGGQQGGPAVDCTRIKGGCQTGGFQYCVPDNAACGDERNKCYSEQTEGVENQCSESVRGATSCTITPNCSGLTCRFTTSFTANGQSQSSYRIIVSPDKSNPAVNSGLRNDDQVVSHTYNPGTYTASLRAQTNDGGTEATCDSPSISPTGPAGLSCTVTQSCSETRCTFNHTYTVGGTVQQKQNYRVNLYPDKNNTNISIGLKNGSETLSHTYTAGTYTARLFAQKNDGSGDITCETSEFTISGGPQKCFVCVNVVGKGNVWRYEGDSRGQTPTGDPNATCTDAENSCSSTKTGTCKGDVTRFLDKPCGSPGQTITKYRFAENPTDLDNPDKAKEGNYQAGGVDVPYTFSNTPGTQTIWYQFGDGAGNWTKAEPKSILLVGADPKITGAACNIRIDIKDNSLIFEIRGDNFGEGVSTVSADGSTLEGNCKNCTWSNSHIIARMANPPDTTIGRTYNVIVNRADGIKSPPQACKVETRQVSVGSEIFCQAPNSFDQQNVNLSIFEMVGVGSTAASSSQVANKTTEKITLNKQGESNKLKTNFNPTLDYIFCLEAPDVYSIEVCSKRIKAVAGNNVITKLDIPIGDYNRNGKIGPEDASLFISQFGPMTANKICDLNRDKICNSYEWSCIKKGYNKVSDQKPL